MSVDHDQADNGEVVQTTPPVLASAEVRLSGPSCWRCEGRKFLGYRWNHRLARREQIKCVTCDGLGVIVERVS